MFLVCVLTARWVLSSGPYIAELEVDNYLELVWNGIVLGFYLGDEKHTQKSQGLAPNQPWNPFVGKVTSVLCRDQKPHWKMLKTQFVSKDVKHI